MDSSPQRPAGPRQVKRVHELAEELEVSSKTVLVTLRSIGAFVKSASSTVDPQTAQRLRQELHRQELSSTFRPGRSPYETAPTELGGQHAGAPDADVSQAPLTGLAKTLRGTFVQLQTDDEASRLAAAWTADGVFTDYDVIAWCQAGLTPRDYAQARQLHAHGVRPHHLDLVVQGKSVKSLLRGGKSVTWVVGLLRQHSHIAP